MLRMRNVCSVAVAMGLAIAGGAAPFAALAQGMPMGTMKTIKEREAKPSVPDAGKPDYGPNQAWAPAPEQKPTYHDTPEDRQMRVLTDDGAHDRSDTQR